MTAHWRIFLEVNLIPEAKGAFSFRNSARSIPNKIAMTAPPMRGKRRPRNQEGTARSRQSRRPFPLVLIHSIRCIHSLSIHRKKSVSFY